MCELRLYMKREFNSIKPKKEHSQLSSARQSYLHRKICKSDTTPAGRHLLSSDNKYIKVLPHRTRRGDTQISSQRPRDVRPRRWSSSREKRRKKTRRERARRERDREMEREMRGTREKRDRQKKRGGNKRSKKSNASAYVETLLKRKSRCATHRAAAIAGPIGMSWH